MASRRVYEGSLRPDQFEISRLLWAILISVAFHLICFGGYELGKEFNIWRAIHLPSWMKKTAMLSALQPAQPRRPEEAPLMFVDVNPHAATTEPPKEAKFYSNKNSEAANPETDKETDVPKITGKQTDIVKAEDVDRAKFDKLQPAIPKVEKKEEPEQAKPKTPQPSGDLAMAKPETNLRQDTGTAEQPRPRTIKEALMRPENRNQLAGQKMKQAGGVPKNRIDASFGVKATPFGVYDAAFIEAVESRWFGLLDNMSYDGYRRGKVVVKFRLQYDGRITDMQIVDNNVGEMLGLLCQKAILDPAPFDKWPREMRLMVEKDYREIQFAFYYN